MSLWHAVLVASSSKVRNYVFVGPLKNFLYSLLSYLLISIHLPRQYKNNLIRETVTRYMFLNMHEYFPRKFDWCIYLFWSVIYTYMNIFELDWLYFLAFWWLQMIGNWPWPHTFIPDLIVAWILVKFYKLFYNCQRTPISKNNNQLILKFHIWVSSYMLCEYCLYFWLVTHQLIIKWAINYVMKQ